MTSSRHSGLPWKPSGLKPPPPHTHHRFDPQKHAVNPPWCDTVVTAPRSSFFFFSLCLVPMPLQCDWGWVRVSCQGRNSGVALPPDCKSRTDGTLFSCKRNLIQKEFNTICQKKTCDTLVLLACVFTTLEGLWCLMNTSCPFSHHFSRNFFNSI